MTAELEAAPGKNAIYTLPQHVAIIMDGNGRWAQQRGLRRLEGHRAGTDNVRRVIKCFHQRGIKYLTLYAFSTENWLRPRSEVRGLFNLLGRVIDSEAQALHRAGVQIRHLGKLEGLSSRLQRQIQRCVDMTKGNTDMTVCIAFNYGGRAELVDAVRGIAQDGIPSQQIDEALIDRYLYTAGLPDPDLIIRTAGEMRLSNFLIWQAAYSEYYFTPTLWPDFNEAEVETALVAYSQRQRKFGGLGRE